MSKTNTNKDVPLERSVRKLLEGKTSITSLKALSINNPASCFKGARTLERKFQLDTMRICNLSSDMWFLAMWHYDECRLRGACAASLLSLETPNDDMFSQKYNTHREFKRLAKALIRLRVCAGWSESLLVAHILFEISRLGSFVAVSFKGATMHVSVGVTSWRNVIRIVTSRHWDHTAACLKELSLTFKLLVIEKNP